MLTSRRAAIIRLVAPARRLLVVLLGAAVLCAPVGASAGAGSRAAPCKALTYRVQAGDTLFALAQRFRTTVPALAFANDLDPDGLLPIGLVLRIPRSCSQAAQVSLATALRLAVASPMTTGATVLDLETGETVYALNADTP